LKEFNGIVRVEGDRYPIQYGKGILADGKLSVLQEHTKKNVEFWSTYFRLDQSAIGDGKSGLVLGQFHLPARTTVFFGGVLKMQKNLTCAERENAIQLDSQWAIVPNLECDLWACANCAQRTDKTVANHLHLQQRTKPLSGPLSGKFDLAVNAQEEIFLDCGRKFASAEQLEDEVPGEQDDTFLRPKSARIAKLGEIEQKPTTPVIYGYGSSKRKKGSSSQLASDDGSEQGAASERREASGGVCVVESLGKSFHDSHSQSTCPQDNTARNSQSQSQSQ
jgi:hypothetical protein